MYGSRPRQDSNLRLRPAPSAGTDEAGYQLRKLEEGVRPSGAPAVPLVLRCEATKPEPSWLGGASRLTSRGWCPSRMLGKVLHLHRRGELW